MIAPSPSLILPIDHLFPFSPLPSERAPDPWGRSASRLPNGWPREFKKPRQRGKIAPLLCLPAVSIPPSQLSSRKFAGVSLLEGGVRSPSSFSALVVRCKMCLSIPKESANQEQTQVGSASWLAVGCLPVSTFPLSPFFSPFLQIQTADH